MKTTVSKQGLLRLESRSVLSTAAVALMLAAGALLAVVCSWALAASRWPIAQTTNHIWNYPFELFGFFGAVFFLAVFAVETRRMRSADLSAMLTPIAALLISLAFLSQRADYHDISFDFRKYEEGAQALLAGKSPYGNGYLYPPLPVQGLVGVYRSANFLAGVFGNRPDSTWGWSVVFFVYEACQIFLLAGIFRLLVRLGRRLSLGELASVLSSAALLLVSSPVVRSLRHNQINFWVLLSTLGAMVLVDSAPLFAGVLLALGIHIKLYPGILLVAFVLTRRWKVVGYCLGAFALIFLIQTSGLTDLSAWKSFVQFSKSFPKGRLFRDNGLHGIVYNMFALPYGFNRPAVDRLLPQIDRVYLLAALATTLLMAWRIWLRERLWSTGAYGEDEYRFRLVPHCCDLIAFSLLCSPLVWEHHYVMAMPLLVFLLAVVDCRRSWVPLLVFLGFQGLPTFEVFPFSYTRVAALFLFLYATRPKRLLRGRLVGEGEENRASPILAETGH